MAVTKRCWQWVWRSIAIHGLSLSTEWVCPHSRRAVHWTVSKSPLLPGQSTVSLLGDNNLQLNLLFIEWQLHGDSVGAREWTRFCLTSAHIRPKLICLFVTFKLRRTCDQAHCPIWTHNLWDFGVVSFGKHNSKGNALNFKVWSNCLGGWTS